MFSSPTKSNGILLSIYQDQRTVFRLLDIGMLAGETNRESLNRKLNYYVRTGKLNNPRKGIYTKPDYQPQELACKLYTPSYISLEYVLQRAGVVFQFDSTISSVSYLSRSIDIQGQIIRYRKLKNELLVNTSGILQQPSGINIASPERAFLDLLYLSPDSYFDNLNPLSAKIICKLLPNYQSKALTNRVKKLFQNV